MQTKTIENGVSFSQNGMCLSGWLMTFSIKKYRVIGHGAVNCSAFGVCRADTGPILFDTHVYASHFR